MTAAPRLEGRVVLVTGSSRGLGREMALALAEAGARVAITGRTEGEALTRTRVEIEALSGCTLALPCDVTDPAACDALVAEVVARLGRLDALVVNAGLGMRRVSETFTTEPTRFWETDPAAWRKIVATNLDGAFHTAAAAARVMVARGGGKIVTVSTSAPTMVRRGYSPYGPAKAALEAASRIWAQDLEGTGVTVNVYLPGGASDTGLIPGGPGRAGADGNLLPAAVMRRGIVWLCSAASDGMTGGRYVARLWDEALPPDEAAAGARDAPSSCPAIM